jgi:hypothetical protein
MTEGLPDRPHVDEVMDLSSMSQWFKLYFSSAWTGLRGPKLPDIEKFCFFIGYAGSGHSVIGSVLNAHPEIVISHELNALRYIEKRFGRAQLFSLILRRDQEFGSADRTWTDHDYGVPNQFQGRYNRLRVIGDKKGARSALLLNKRPELLDRLRRTVTVPIRVIHVTRNPFDSIVSQAVRRDMGLRRSTYLYEKSCQAVASARSLLGPTELFDLAHESFTENPKVAIADLCAFVGVEPGESYLDDCAEIVWPTTNRRRDAVEWSLEERRGVEELIARYSFLSQYSFEA